MTICKTKSDLPGVQFAPAAFGALLVVVCCPFLAAGNETWNMVTLFELSATNAKVVTLDAIAAAEVFFADPRNSNANLTLFYPAGIYTFGEDDATGDAIGLRDFIPGQSGRLIFRGAGRLNTMFVINNNQDWSDHGSSQYGIHVKRSRRITFKDFHLTVVQQTVTQGEVRRIGQKFVDLDIQDGFPDPTDLEFDRQSASGRFLRRYTNHVSNPRIDTRLEQIEWTESWQTRDPGRSFRFRSKTAHQFQMGDLIGVKAKHGKDPYRFVDCADIEMLNIELSRKSRGLFLNCRDTLVSNMLVRREIVNGRVACLATPGGGPQFHRRSGGYRRLEDDFLPRNPGNVVENCFMIGTGDDCVAVFEQRFPVIRNNVFRESFARGVYDHRCLSAVMENNQMVRSNYLEDDTLRPLTGAQNSH